MTTPPSFRKVNPGDFPVLYHQPDFADAAAVDGERIRRDRCWRSRSRNCPASPRCWFTARRNSPCACRSIRWRRRRATSRSTTSAPSLRKTNSNTPVGTLCRAQADVTLLGIRRDAARRPTTATSWWPIATARRSSSTRSPTSSTASRTTRSPAGSTTSAPSCWRSSASPTPIRSRWSTWCAAGCRNSARRCRPSINMEVLHRPLDLDPRSRSTDVQETLAIAICLVVLVIFLFLRSVSATIIPALGGAGVADRHLRGDVCVRVLDQQHDAAGADAVGRLRGRRRHRHAGEHRPPHRGRHAAVRGGAQGRARDRLHHHLDHVLADRGVHPGAADGRHGRPRVPRVRGVDRGRDHHFRASSR